ncbi:GTP cyclohydrolase II-domain-containing protein [Thamnocephalis sphaerospora]|uniref:GTP cyclohydrolase II n=1 Tax=Thamnocephalis sphaerospora TaxID=78915 RepID=A0A4P9XLX6_9FUNG|nr:GTP cyclohydrolase II-domain-containing protein [Thamnocephalis sphaerospora]|eukprot:RKP06897.1 GTP cyclohydrolase II-domain-containing protein [Thamnocephalis sphaerospora]
MSQAEADLSGLTNPPENERCIKGSQANPADTPPVAIVAPPSPPESTTPHALPHVECMVRTRLPTTVGTCHVYLYRNDRDDKEHLAIVFGDRQTAWSRSLERPRAGESEMDRIVRGAAVGEGSHLQGSMQQAPLVRLHSECFTGETLGSVRCDCGEQLLEAMRAMHRQGHGIIVYLRQEGRGIGLLEKLKAYNLQDLGHDTVAANLMLSHPADARNYDVAVAILHDLGSASCRLLTNNPDKIEQLERGGSIRVVERVPMIPERWQQADTGDRARYTPNEMDSYLLTKVERMRHLLDLPRSVSEALSAASSPAPSTRHCL